ncbi:MAG: VCBS repeat-containing protein, partial [Myxococcota bacterium]
STVQGQDLTKRRSDYIDPIYVENILMAVFPHIVLPNADVRFRLAPSPLGGPAPTEDPSTTPPTKPTKEVRVEGYRMDAIRDTAIHWQLLKQVWEERPFAMDPFAAEVLSENLSVILTLFIDLLAEPEHRSSDLGDRTLVMPRDDQPIPWSKAREAQRLKALAPYEAGKAMLYRDASASLGLSMKEPEVWRTNPNHLGSSFRRGMLGGSGVGDINGDGWPDLFVVAEGLAQLLLNRGAKAPGSFTDATAAWGLSGAQEIAWIGSSLLFDRDGDGDLDLLLVGWNGSRLYDNMGKRFKEVTEAVGLRTERGALSATVFDADNDGDLDIYIGYYGSHAFNSSGCTPGIPGPDAPSICKASELDSPSLDGRNGSANQLWRLEADDTYVEVGAESGVADVGWTLSVGAFDLDQDRDQDLYLANDFGRNTLLRNNGDGTFEDITHTTLTGDRGSGMNVSVTDLNADGYWDLYVSNIDMYNKRIKVVWPTDNSPMKLDAQILRGFRYITGNKLYLYNPDPAPGGAMYTSAEHLHFEPGDRGWSWAALFVDVDNDGDED